MVLLHSPKEGEPGIREMQSVVQPLFGDITFDDACKQYRHGVNGKESTDRPCEEKQSQSVLQFPADMFSIERPQGMIPVKGIGPYLQESQDHAVARRKSAVQNKTVNEVLDASPDQAACREESDGGPGVGCPEPYHHHEDCEHRVEDGQRIEAKAGNRGLRPIVVRKGHFHGPWLRR